jgi:hypothetical protein
VRSCRTQDGRQLALRSTYTGAPRQCGPGVVNTWPMPWSTTVPTLVAYGQQRGSPTDLGARGRDEITGKTVRTTRRPYLLRSLIVCGLCQRKMQGQHSHGAVYYRCRLAQEYAIGDRSEHPRNVVLREDHLVHPLDAWMLSRRGARRPMSDIRRSGRRGTSRFPSIVSRTTLRRCGAGSRGSRRAVRWAVGPRVRPAR